MKILKYVGPHVAVDVPLPNGGAVMGVRQGDEVTVTDDHAARLLEQSSNWAAVVAPAKKKGGE